MTDATALLWALGAYLYLWAGYWTARAAVGTQRRVAARYALARPDDAFRVFALALGLAWPVGLAVVAVMAASTVDWAARVPRRGWWHRLLEGLLP